MVDFVDAVANDAQDTWERPSRKPLPAHAGGPVPRCDRLRMRLRAGRDWSVLLSERSEGLPGSRVFPRAVQPLRSAWRLRAGVRHRPRVRPSRSEPARSDRPRPAGPEAGGVDALLSPWSCRRTASLASGAMRRRSRAGSRLAGSSSSPATPKRRCVRPRRLATTACSACPPAGSRPNDSRTAVRLSASSGSGGDSSRGIPDRCDTFARATQ